MPTIARARARNPPARAARGDVRATFGIERFVAEVMPDNGAMLRRVRGRRLRGRAASSRAACSRSASRSRPPRRTGAGSTSATTSPSRSRSGPSSRPRRSPCSAPPAGADRSAASSSATSSRADFAGVAYPVNRAGRAGRRRPRPRARSRRSRRESTSPSSAFPASRCDRRRRGGARGRRPRALRDLGRVRRDRPPRAPSARIGCSRSSAAHGARLIGPNCLGIAVARRSAERDVRAARVPAGHDRLLVAERCARPGAAREGSPTRGLGLSAFVSIGNKADVSSNDLLEYWEDDAATDVVLLYLESFGNPRRFARIARRVARQQADPRDEERDDRAPARGPPARTPPRSPDRKPPSTRCSGRQASSAPRRSSELIDPAALLSSQPLPRGRRVAVLTNAGGLGILCADACDGRRARAPGARAEHARPRCRRRLPAKPASRNPVDMLGSATADDLRGRAAARCSPTRASTR